jgi:hypothetical protein
MKTKFIFLNIMFFINITAFAQVGIGTETPETTAALDVVSATRGFLYPRVSTAQRLAIAAPADGLQVYDLDLHCLMIFQNGAWECPNGITPACITTSAAVSYSDMPLTRCTRGNPASMTATIDAFADIYDPQSWLTVSADHKLVFNRAGRYLVALYGTLKRINLGPVSGSAGSNTYSSISLIREGDAAPEVLGYVDLPGQTPGAQTFLIHGIIEAATGDVYVLRYKAEAIADNYNWAEFIITNPYIRIQALK